MCKHVQTIQPSISVYTSCGFDLGASQTSSSVTWLVILRSGPIPQRAAFLLAAQERKLYFGVQLEECRSFFGIWNVWFQLKRHIYYVKQRRRRKKKELVGELARWDGNWHCNRKTRWWLRGFLDLEASVCIQVNIDVFERRKSVSGMWQDVPSERKPVTCRCRGFIPSGHRGGRNNMSTQMNLKAGQRNIRARTKIWRSSVMQDSLSQWFLSCQWTPPGGRESILSSSRWLHFSPNIC